MLTILEGKDENAQAQKMLEKAFLRAADRTEKLSLGWQGGSIYTEVSWSSKLRIWWAFLDDRDGTARYWRPFGIEEPRWGTAKSHSIACEINSPFRGCSRQIGGALAHDIKGNLFLVHRGNIGGGRRGIGISLFFERTLSEICEVSDSKGKTVAALVGGLDHKRFCWQVAEFVRDVHRIKQLASQAYRPESKQVYHREFSGIKEYQTTSNVTADCDHGLIVDAMRRELESRGLKVGNDQFRDLYILNHRNEIETIFEFKTDSTRSSVYSAIGQLLFNAIARRKTRLIAVFPETLSQSVARGLKQLRIECITYGWQDNYPQFHSLRNMV